MGSVALVLQLALGARLYLQPAGSSGLVGFIHMEETEGFRHKSKFEV